MIAAARKKLTQFRRLQCCVDDTNRKAEEIRQQATGITQNFTGLPGGGNSIPAAQRMVEQLEQLAREAELATKGMFEQSSKIIHRLQLVHNPTYRDLLWAHYINGMTLKKACMSCKQKNLHYSYDWMRHLSTKALLAYGKVMKETQTQHTTTHFL